MAQMAKDGLKKIAVLGAESTGKSWLCEQLAAHYRTAWVPEYAREYFNNSDIYNYTLNDLVLIAQSQLKMERETAPAANHFLFCDTSLITLKIWAELEFQTTPAFIEEGLQNNHYDFFLITNNDVLWQADPLRQNKHSRDLLFQLNETEVKKTGIPYEIISGLDRERLNNAIRAIDHLR